MQTGTNLRHIQTVFWKQISVSELSKILDATIDIQYEPDLLLHSSQHVLLAYTGYAWLDKDTGYKDTGCLSQMVLRIPLAGRPRLTDS